MIISILILKLSRIYFDFFVGRSGFVLVEASFCRTPILTSNAWPGPVELIKDNLNGVVFENNNIDNFIKKFKDFQNQKKINHFKLNNLRLIKRFTLFHHYKSLSKLLQ